jgi:nucleoside-diphosphate-sugar epimerase
MLAYGEQDFREGSFVLVLITGANGFVGRHLSGMLAEAGHEVVAAIRHDSAPGLPDAVRVFNVGDLTPGTYWRDAMQGVDTVVHLAARTHVMEETAANPMMAYRRINVEATRRLVTEAAVLGIKRVVLMSSIKVNGEATHGRPFTAEDTPAPEDPYGKTKRDAEIETRRATEGTNTEFVILRAPLVYGAGVKGNFLALMEAVAAGKWLPLGMIANRRSLVGTGNLASALKCAVEHPAAAGRTYLVRDGEDLSTAQLCRRIGKALGTPTKLLPVPAGLLRLAGRITGKGPQIARLTDSLEIDDAPIRAELGWQPPYSVDQGLELTAAWFKSRGNEPL